MSPNPSTPGTRGTTDAALRAGATGPPDRLDTAPATPSVAPAKGKGERTRRNLLQAAEEVFGAMGYHDASIVKITELAGVAQGTFYLYFSSKLQIFDEVVADLNQRVRHAMSEAARGATTRLEAERLGFAGFFRFTAEHPALYRVIRQAEFVSPQALRQHYETIIESYIPHLGDAMASGEVAPGDPAVLAWSLIAVGEAIGMRWILWNEAHEVPPAVFEEMMAIIARMLGATPEPHSSPSRSDVADES
ncbi:MAG TPA: TetR/AcrR family transcriptional regulator [Acidimicrobiales bacterium]|nr:TetR/AcrR family transcriptional regulator [Acidimicrobiales bacterium]